MLPIPCWMVWHFLAKCSAVTGRNRGTFPAPTKQSENRRNKDAVVRSPPTPQDRSVKTRIHSCTHRAKTPPFTARPCAHQQASTFPLLVMDNSTYRGTRFGAGGNHRQGKERGWGLGVTWEEGQGGEASRPVLGSCRPPCPRGQPWWRRGAPGRRRPYRRGIRQ